MTKRADELTAGDVIAGLGRIAVVGVTRGQGLVKARDATGSWLLLLSPDTRVTLDTRSAAER